MTSTHTRVLAGLLALATAAAVTSCSAKTEQRSAPSSPPTTAEQGIAEHNSDDVMFAQMMIPHHQQALELSALVPDRSTDPALIKLAATIAAEQQPEIDTMKALLVQWDVSPGGMADHSGHMMGMVDEATMAQLRELKGPAFDTLWLQSMISHHQGAIAMAKPEAGSGKNPDMISLARNIITGQQAEIDQMNQMLAAMGG